MKTLKTKLNQFIYFLLLTIVATGISAQQAHQFLVEKYDALHNSPMQQKFRQLHPMPAGVVYIQQPGDGEQEMR